MVVVTVFVVVLSTCCEPLAYDPIPRSPRCFSIVPISEHPHCIVNGVVVLSTVLQLSLANYDQLALHIFSDHVLYFQSLFPSEKSFWQCKT